MSTKAEELTMLLIPRGMTKPEIATRLGVTADTASKTIDKMRHNVLPDLNWYCPRATHENGYVYQVFDAAHPDDGRALTEAGARIMHKDNRRRAQTMLDTAKPYADMLDGRSKEGRVARTYVKAASLVLAALDLLEVE